MTKQELMENYTLEQLADMVVDLQKENLTEILKLKNREYTEDVRNVLDAMRLTITELCNTIEGLRKEHAKMLWEHCDCVGKEEYEKLKEELKEQTEHYKYSMMQIDDVLVEFLGVTHEVMDKPSDFEKVLEEKISSYKDRIRELEMELEYKDGTKMFETLMENTEGEAKDLLAQHMYENLKCVRKNVIMEDDVRISDLLPSAPIKVADMLISAKGECGKDEPWMGAFKCNLYGIPQLRQIAQHLLIYCGASEKE